MVGDSLIISYFHGGSGVEDIPAEGKPLDSRNENMEALIRGFEKRLLRDLGDKKRSRESYLATLRKFLGHGNIKGKKLENWTKKDVNAVYDDWASETVWKKKERKWGVRDSNTMAQNMSAMNRFFDFVERPDLRQKTPPLNHKEVIPLTEEETLRVAEAAKKEGFFPHLGTRNYTMVLMCADLAERNGEVTYVKRTDIDTDKKKIYLRDTKGGGDQSVPLSPAVEEAMNAYLKVRPKGKTPEDEEFLFLSKSGRRIGTKTTWRVVQAAAYRAGIVRPVWPHLLRHTRLTVMGNKGVPPFDILSLSRHKDYKTLQNYIHPNEEKVAKEVRDTSIFRRDGCDGRDKRILDEPSQVASHQVNDGCDGCDGSPDTASSTDAKTKLALRLANGEIGEDTYKQAVLALNGGILEVLR